ncbi:MAG: 4'-phosphopantetheinyl transferase, partial [Proteobacteria bacterium]|nr:4'-phosphopantetheinyl transferase [Pseudomonadota bacterium]
MICVKKLGRDCDAILAGVGREPLWPEGSIGSISHARPLSVAVVAP